MSIFDNYEIFAFAISKRKLIKLSNDTRIINIEALLLKIWGKDCVYFVSFSLFLQSFLLNISKQAWPTIRYLSLWCVTYNFFMIDVKLLYYKVWHIFKTILTHFENICTSFDKSFTNLTTTYKFIKIFNKICIFITLLKWFYPHSLIYGVSSLERSTCNSKSKRCASLRPSTSRVTGEVTASGDRWTG